MEEFLIKAIEEKIQNLEKTQLEEIEKMKKEQKIDEVYAQLNKNKEEALAEIRNHGAGSKEASIDLEKIEKELEKVKIEELNIVKKVKREISVTKGYLTEINNIVSEKENKQKENETIEKDIRKLIEYKEEALEEIRSHGAGSKEAREDIEKIEIELKNKNEIKEKNKEIIEQANKKIEQFKQRSIIKKILEENLNKDWDTAIKENEEFDKKHNMPELDKNDKVLNKEDLRNKKEEKVEEEKSNKKTEEKAKEKIEEQVDGQTNNQINKKTGKNNIVLDISANKINVNEKEELFYKEEAKNKQNIIREYGIGSIFLNDKKAKKNIDYALISTLEKIDKSLVEAYLKVIRDGESQSKEVKECLEKINNAVDITYKFDKEDGIFRNLREKKIARNAKKLGIASLDGISEKSIFDKIKESFSKFGNKLLNGREKPKELTSGENTISQATLENEENTITQDQKEQGIRESLKVDNRGNKIEIAAQKKHDKDSQEIDEANKAVAKIVQDENDAIEID